MLVKSVVSFAHSHDIKVIAEGVEPHEDLVYLIQHDIDYLQGYYIAKPAYAIKDIEESKQQEIRAIYKEIQKNRKAILLFLCLPQDAL